MIFLDFSCLLVFFFATFWGLFWCVLRPASSGFFQQGMLEPLPALEDGSNASASGVFGACVLSKPFQFEFGPSSGNVIFFLVGLLQQIKAFGPVVKAATGRN